MKTKNEIRSAFLTTLRVENSYWSSIDPSDIVEQRMMESRRNLITELMGKVVGEAEASEIVTESEANARHAN